jgi:hypothetical protein
LTESTIRWQGSLGARALFDRERALLFHRISRRGAAWFRSHRFLWQPTTGRQSILLNTMPKSGSVYVARSLAAILRLPMMHIGNQYALIGQIDPAAARTFKGGGFVSQNHLAPSAENLHVLQHFKLRMVLHLRDPRQALLSWVHYLRYITGGHDAREELLYVTPRLPLGYFRFSLAEQIDWQIENYMPQLVLWAARWVEIADRLTIPMLITHQNDLRTEEKAFFDRILAFYQLDRDYALPNLPRTMNETHFRRADPMEWRCTFTTHQTARATSLIPKSLSMRFGWDESVQSAQIAVPLRRRA